MQFSINLLKFEDIREEIKNFFLEKNIEYTEGSNFSNLIDAIAINNMVSAYYTTVAQNEQYLSTCKTRENAVRIAKSLGYIPKRKIPSKFDLKIRYTGAFSNTRTKFTVNEIKFLGKNTNYIYIANDVEFIKNTTDEFFTASFTVFEKTLSKSVFYGNNDINQSFIIANENISADNIDVRTISSSNTRWIDFAKYNSEFNENFNETSAVPDSTSKIFFIEEDETLTYCPKIIFGNGIIGSIPTTDDIIEITYYETHGSLGNVETEIDLISVSCTDSIETNVDNFIITEQSYVYGGKDNETLEEIQLYAPKYFQDSLVAITESDYKRLVLANENNILYLDIIGGDKYKESEVFHLGKTYISVVPTNFRQIDASIPTNERVETFPLNEIYSLSLNDYDDVFVGGKQTFLDKIESRTIVSTSRKVISPSYLWLDIEPFIELKDRYLNFNDVARSIYNQLEQFANENFLGMGKKYREDQLIEIMDSDTNIFSSSIRTNFHVLTNSSNITDSYVIAVPTDFIKTNYEQYQEDIKFNSQTYEFTNMPIERRTIFADLDIYTKTLVDGSTLDFHRYLINTNLASSASMRIFANCYFDITQNTDPTDDTFDLNTSISSTSYIGTGSNFAKTRVYNQSIFSTHGSIPLQFLGSDPTIATTFYGIYDETYSGLNIRNRWFVYLIEGNKQTLIAEILQTKPFGTRKEYVFIARTITNTNYLASILSNYGIVQKTDVDPYFYYTISSERNIENKGKDFSVKMYFDDNTGQLSDTELIQVVSRHKVGTCYIDTNGLIAFNIESDTYFDYLIDTVNTEIVIFDKQWNETNSETLEICRVGFSTEQNFEVTTSNAISGMSTAIVESFKSGKYQIALENENYNLYFYETIDETNIGEYNKEEGKISFYQTVEFYINSELQRYILDDFFNQYNVVNSKNNDKEIIDIRLIQKNLFDDDGRITGKKSDINAAFGICTIPNIKMPKAKVI